MSPVARRSPQALADLASTCLDNGTELDALATFPAAEQRGLAAEAATAATLLFEPRRRPFATNVLQPPTMSVTVYRIKDDPEGSEAALAAWEL